MKKQLLFFSLFFSLWVFGQKEIQVTKNNTVMLIFPEAVSNHNIGNVYEYIIYESKNQNPIDKRIIRLGYNIKGRGETKTNLSVLTKDGLLYEFIINYVDSIPKLTHRISKSDAVADLSGTNENDSADTPGLITVETETIRTPASSYTEDTQTKSFDLDKMMGINPAIAVNDSLYTENKEVYIYLQCKNTQLRKKRIARTFDKAYNVILRLKSVNYDKNELYVYMTLENEGPQAYDIDFAKFAITTVKKGNRTDQEPPHLPPYVYEMPKQVNGNTHHHFIAVFDKFPLSRDKELWVEMREKNGGRNLVLKIDHKIINNPHKF